MAQFGDSKRHQNDIKALRAREEESLAQILSEKYDVEYVNLAFLPVDTEALRMIDEMTAREANIAAFDISGKRLSVITTTPNNTDTQNIIDNLKRRGYQVIVYMGSNPSLNKALEHYREISFATQSRAGVLEISEENIDRYFKAIENLEDSTKVVDEALNTKSPYRVTMVIEAMVASALATNASDIHIEPSEEDARFRLRLDGILSDVLGFEKSTYNQLLSRLKLIARVKLNIKNPQDGRFTISLHEKDIEVRASFLPGEHGESVVMRILDPDSIKVSLGELGMHPTVLEIMRKEIKRPNGMILNTGPTGSGKTTTLYSFLQEINSPEIKIITIEDPVEYQIDGLVQTQVSKSGISFASGLRSIMRQDPDVILVGEIRDSDTADIAVQAALTGHLVFSTLHTNNAAGTFPRLIDLEADPKTLGSALTATMAQRLVRVLCNKCHKKIPILPENKAIVDRALSDLPNNIERPQSDFQYEAVGCTECDNRGYKGRVGIFEIILVTDEISDLLHREGNPSEREVLQIAKEQGILNMKQDAVLKILEGRTSFEEVRRVIDL